eukprot:15471033-Alexandrium_andersonii.AAC.1
MGHRIEGLRIAARVGCSRAFHPRTPPEKCLRCAGQYAWSPALGVRHLIAPTPPQTKLCMWTPRTALLHLDCRV